MLETVFWREITVKEIVKGMHVAAIRLDPDGLLTAVYGRVSRIYTTKTTMKTFVSLWNVTTVKRNFDRSASLAKYLEGGQARYSAEADLYRWFQTKREIESDNDV